MSNYPTECPPDCACHCHTDAEEIPPGHLPTCALSDPEYMHPEDAEAFARMGKVTVQDRGAN